MIYLHIICNGFGHHLPIRKHLYDSYIIYNTVVGDDFFSKICRCSRRVIISVAAIIFFKKRRVWSHLVGAIGSAIVKNSKLICFRRIIFSYTAWKFQLWNIPERIMSYWKIRSTFLFISLHISKDIKLYTHLNEISSDYKCFFIVK